MLGRAQGAWRRRQRWRGERVRPKRSPLALALRFSLFSNTLPESAPVDEFPPFALLRGL